MTSRLWNRTYERRTHHHEMLQCVVVRITVVDADRPQREAVTTVTAEYVDRLRRADQRWDVTWRRAVARTVTRARAAATWWVYWRWKVVFWNGTSRSGTLTSIIVSPHDISLVDVYCISLSTYVMYPWNTIHNIFILSLYCIFRINSIYTEWKSSGTEQVGRGL